MCCKGIQGNIDVQDMSLLVLLCPVYLKKQDNILLLVQIGAGQTPEGASYRFDTLGALLLQWTCSVYVKGIESVACFTFICAAFVKTIERWNFLELDDI